MAIKYTENSKNFRTKEKKCLKTVSAKKKTTKRLRKIIGKFIQLHKTFSLFLRHETWWMKTNNACEMRLRNHLTGSRNAQHNDERDFSCLACCLSKSF